MSHIPYFGQETQPNLNEALNRLERAIEVYSVLVLGDDDVPFDKSLSTAERINNAAEFLESIV